MISLRLYIEFNANPVSGILEDSDGDRHEFTGWLGLSDLLRRIGEREGAPHSSGASHSNLAREGCAEPE